MMPNLKSCLANLFHAQKRNRGTVNRLRITSCFCRKNNQCPPGAGYSGTLKSTGGMLSGTVSGERYIAVKVPDDSFTQDAVELPVIFAILKDYKMVGETSGVVFTINVIVHLKLNEQNEGSLEATDVQISCG